ncbi:unnamed protein product [Linum tenue]|uniref:Uncharacterized protein n=1 Tax=Linum tenue TaxID=586396 RepID=A0AAV0KLK3_9ROSI|nr:unnamed protein product [Linum tenue]
MHSRCAAYA